MLTLDKKGICDYQKNRDPYLLIDYASEIVPGKSAKGYKDLNEDEYKKVVAVIQTLSSTDVDFDWMVDTTEKFCKDKAIYNAILDGIHIIDGKSKDQTPEALPQILIDALSVSFDLISINLFDSIFF